VRKTSRFEDFRYGGCIISGWMFVAYSNIFYKCITAQRKEKNCLGTITVHECKHPKEPISRKMFPPEAIILNNKRLNYL
jgi:hypothetical protein